MNKSWQAGYKACETALRGKLACGHPIVALNSHGAGEPSARSDIYCVWCEDIQRTHYGPGTQDEIRHLGEQVDTLLAELEQAKIKLNTELTESDRKWNNRLDDVIAANQVKAEIDKNTELTKLTLAWSVEIEKVNEELRLARLERDFAVKDADGWKREFNMYRSAWLREIGGEIRRKTYEIDGFVLRTRDIYEQSKKAGQVERQRAMMQTVLLELRKDLITISETPHTEDCIRYTPDYGCTCHVGTAWISIQYLDLTPMPGRKL